MRCAFSWVLSMIRRSGSPASPARAAKMRPNTPKRPRWHVHFTPTGASWINQVERFFADLTEEQIRRGVHRSTAQLEADIRAFIDAHNADPKPFRWTKSADNILAAIQRFCLRSQQIGGIAEPVH